eukprot:1392094-Rhodomonas_salina.5
MAGGVVETNASVIAQVEAGTLPFKVCLSCARSIAFSRVAGTLVPERRLISRSRPCPVLAQAMLLRARYALSGTDV